MLLLLLLVTALHAGCGSNGQPEASGTAATAPTKVNEARLPPGKYLYLGGSRLTVVDVDAEASWDVRRPRLYPGDPRFPLIRRGRHLVYYGPGGGTYSVDLNLLERPRRLDPESVGGFGYFFPSANPNRVWVGLGDPKRPLTADLTEIREVSATGKVTSRARAPRGSWPMIALRDWLTFSQPHSTRISLWNPDSREVQPTRATGFAEAAHENLLVTGGPSYSTPYLQLIDVPTGRERLVRPPAGLNAFDGARAVFSPDGELLAVPVTPGRELVGARWLALINAESGHVRVIPGSRVDPGGSFVSWASDGRSVFMSGGANGPKSPPEIVVYSLGGRSAESIDIRVDSVFGMAAS